MPETVYIRMRNRVEAREDSKIYLIDTAQIVADESLLRSLSKLVVYEITTADKQMVVLDVMKVIKKLSLHFPELDIQAIGPSHTVIEVMEKKQSSSLLLFMLVWLLLFIGSGLTILNFHEEVSMHKVHQKLYWIITGMENPNPLLLQVPYSLGVGAGMILFFNHIFKKKFNEEPSPLEIEMFNYQQNINTYVSIKENKESVRELDSD